MDTHGPALGGPWREKECDMMKRLLSLCLCLALLVSAAPVEALAQDGTGLCPHHLEHTTECGYREASDGSPCNHSHDGSCGYVQGSEEIPCDKGCTDTDGDGNVDHAADCAYAPPVAEVPCNHSHDDTCGYAEAVTASPCAFQCQECQTADQACVCTVRCAEGSGDGNCPVCAQDPTACDGKEPEPSNEPAAPSVEPATVVTQWVWATSEQLTLQWNEDAKQWQMSLPGRVENAAGWQELMNLLPHAVTATLADNSTQELSLTWACEAHARRDCPGSGEHLFAAALPQGYSLGTECPAIQAVVTLQDLTLDPKSTGGFTVTGGVEGTDYSYSDGVLTILTETPLTISSGDTTTDTMIAIEPGVRANLTLAGVHIQPAYPNIPVSVPSGASLTLTLAENSQNTITAGDSGSSHGVPGIHVPAGAALTIQGSGTLEVQGSNAASGHAGAGIGGVSASGDGGDGGAVTITGGTVIVTGGKSESGAGGVGIGGGCAMIGNGGDGGTVTITGGVVTVTGGSSGSGVGGAGIGGGCAMMGNGGDGGTVILLTNATVTGGTDRSGSGAAIGGGKSHLHLGSSGAEGAGIKPGSSENTYQVYGNLTLPRDLTISAGNTLTIPQGNTLTIPQDKTLTNSGALVNDGVLEINGALNTANGQVTESGSRSGTGTITKNSQAPAAPTLNGEAGTHTVTVNALSGLTYACTTENTAPDASSSQWTAPTGATLTFENLNSGDTYYIWAYRAGSDYYEAKTSAALTAYTKPLITTTSLMDATVGQSYTAQLSVTSQDPVTWSVESGDLPAGLKLENGSITGTPTAAGTQTFTLQAATSGGKSTQKLSITVSPAAAQLTLTVKNGDDASTSFVYGDTVTVEGAVASAQSGTVALYNGTTKLTDDVSVASDGRFTLTYATAGKKLPIGTGIQLTVTYTLGADTASGTAAIDLGKKNVTAQVDGAVTKEYDQSDTVQVKLKVTQGLVSGDTVTGTVTGTFPDANVGAGKAVTLGSPTWSGQADWYTIALPTGVTGSITKATIAGSLTITGQAVYENTLTAVYTPLSGETVSYQWYRGNYAITSAKSQTYTVGEYDLGEKLTVTATATDGNHTGRVVSRSVTVPKLSQKAPSTAPRLSRRSTTTIVLRALASNSNGAAAEYGISYDGGDTWHWQSSTRFTGLEINTTYTFAQRYRELGNYAASPMSATRSISTTTEDGDNPWTGDDIRGWIAALAVSTAGLVLIGLWRLFKRKRK